VIRHRKAGVANQGVSDLANLGAGIFPRLMQMAPYGRRPAWIARLSSDDVQMKLRHNVADGGEVYFGIGEVAFDEFDTNASGKSSRS